MIDIFNFIYPKNKSVKRGGCCGITKSSGGGKYDEFQTPPYVTGTAVNPNNLRL
jgi:hypothetical protein